MQSLLQVQKCVIEEQRFRAYKETCNRRADEDIAQQALFKEEMNAQWREIQQTLSRQSHTETFRQHKQMVVEITKLSNVIDGKMVKPCLFPPVPGMAVRDNACFSFIQILRYHFNIWCSQRDLHVLN